MIDLRQSTSKTISIGPFVDATDFSTLENALTITPAQRKLSKAGGTLAATSDGSNATFDADGRYRCTLTTTDTNTVGELTLQVGATGAALYWQTFRVLPAQVYDSIYVHPLIGRASHYGTAQAGASLSIQLASGASSTDNAYRYCLVYIYGGTGAGQWNYGTGYTASSRTLAVANAWPVANPDSTSQYAIIPEASISTLAEVADAIWDEQMTGALGAYNARPTGRQALAELILNGRTVVQSSNNLLTKDTDGTTTVRTRALSPDATTPTSRTVTG